MKHVQEVDKSRWAIMKGNARQVSICINGQQKQCNKYYFALSIPIAKKIANSDEYFIVTGFLVYVDVFTYEMTIGFLNEDHMAEPEKMPNLKVFTSESSLFEDLKYNLQIDRIETELFLA